MCGFDYSWFNNDENLNTLQIGRRVLKEVLNYHSCASKLQFLIHTNRGF